jgi:hypothetical protein
MTSRIENGMELDAMYGHDRRPELRRLEGWTPESDGHGVQNRGWDGIGRHAWKGKASRIEDGMELDATYGHDRRPKLRMLEGWTPAGERHGVQNRGSDGIGRHAWKWKASKIENVGRMDARE